MAMEGARISVRVQPGASKEEVLGYAGGLLRVRVSAPPQEGRANKAMVDLPARVLGVRRSQVTVLRGAQSRNKVLLVEGLSQGRMEEFLLGMGRRAGRHISG